MLSSGTLNLKFMQRNNTAKNQEVNPKIETNSSSVTNLRDTTADLNNKAKRRVNNISSSVDLNQDPTPKWTIIYEESLIHFPFLYPTSRPSIDTILPVHLGRQSFGHSSKSTQKTDQPTSQNKRAKLDTSSSKKSEKHSKKQKIESQDAPKAHSHPIHQEPHQTETQAQSSSTSNERRLKNEEERKSRETTSKGMFQAPFGSTTIKSKRHKTTNTTNLATDSTTESQKNINKSDVTAVDSNKPQDSIVISDEENSDDTEMVKNQIEMMFMEARNAQIASTG